MFGRELGHACGAEETNLSGLILEAAEELIKNTIPALKRFREVPRSRSVGRRRELGGAGNVEGCDERSEEWLEQLDEESLKRIKEVFDVCQLQDTLVRDLPGPVSA